MLRTLNAKLLAMYLIAARAISTLAKRLFIPQICTWGMVATLAACATPQPPVVKAVYDFGPVAVLAAPPTPAAGKPALALADVEAAPALDNPAVLYRLGYADALQLRPYTLARWSMAPARLVQQRLRDTLSADRAVVSTAEAGTPWLLKLELDEFSQIFDAPSSSAGVVRLRATLLRAGQLIAQRSFSARSAAPSADAAGGVRALASASNDAVKQINAWLGEQVK